MSLAEHHHVVETLASYRADQPFGMAVLPRRTRRGRSISNPDGANTPRKHLAINPIAVANEIGRRIFPPDGLSHLLGDPFGRRMCRHTDPQDSTPVMFHNQQSI